MWEYTLHAAIVAGILFAVVLWRHPERARTKGGRLLSITALLVLPLTLSVGGTSRHLEQSKSTRFCLSCHAMEPYGKSLLIDSKEHIPAVHYQNRLVPRDKACFTCHTQYTMYGDLKAKMSGLKHLWVQYLGTVPDKIELYKPYNKRECLHCHGGTRSYGEASAHDEDAMAMLESGEISCFECHEKTHDVHDLDGMKLWEERVK